MSTKEKWHNIRDLEKRFGPMTLGLFIRSFRDAEELSQAQYAKKLGLSRANLCDLEKGRKIASPQRAFQIAKKMGVSPEILIKLALQDVLREAKLKYKIELVAA